jgi:hypothetical protein
MADLTETFVAGVGPHLQKTGQGLKCLVFTVTKPLQNDTVTFEDFSVVRYADAKFTTGGTNDAVTISATTPNQITLAGATTGALRIVAFGY